MYTYFVSKRIVVKICKKPNENFIIDSFFKEDFPMDGTKLR